MIDRRPPAAAARRELPEEAALGGRVPAAEGPGAAGRAPGPHQEDGRARWGLRAQISTAFLPKLHPQAPGAAPGSSLRAPELSYLPRSAGAGAAERGQGPGSAESRDLDTVSHPFPMAPPGGPPGDDCSHIIDHSHVPEFEVALWIKITLILVNLLICALGLLGNSVTIRATQLLQRKGYLQKAVTDHMVSLACSDILVFVVGMPMEFYSIIWNPLTTPGHALSCKLHNFLFEACSYATLLHVLTLSFERYVAICHPFRYKAVSGPCQVKLLIAFVWVTSALVALPLLFAMGVEYPLAPGHSHPRSGLACNRTLTRHHERPQASNMSICTNLAGRWPVFQSSIFGAFVVYLVVLVAVAFMCWNMMQVLRGSKQGTLAARGQQAELRKSESEESRAARRQTILFLRLIVLTLAICWMPNQIRRIMAASRPKHDWTRAYFQAYMTLLPFSDTFFYLSSVINPLLYNVSSRQFRAVFWQVLRCRLTLLHANQERRLRGLAASASASPGDSARSRRPLLRLASRRSSSSSTRTSPKVFLSTFQSEAGAGAKPQPSSPESPEPGSETALASAAAENGVQEHEV